MGTSTNAMLMYGYDLGGGDGPWKLEGVDEYDGLERPWLGEDDDFEEAAMKVLLATVGYVAPDEYVAGEYQRKADAEQRLGLTVEYHCSGDYPMYVLSAKTYTAHRGDCDVVDFTIDSEWNERLARGLEALGLKPTQPEPCWLLASYWG